MKFLSILYTFSYLLLFPDLLSAQHTESLRYQAPVFEKVLRTKNGTYQSSTENRIAGKAGLFDFYEAKGDSAALRPLIIWMHGGGFKLGKKTARGIPGWCRQFAQKGYACAAINYRKSKKKPFSKFPDLVEGCYSAVLDLQQAVHYFKQHSSELKIDSSRIFLAGNSAGAMVALQAAFSSSNQLSALFDSATQGGTDSGVFIPGVAGVIAFWGCVFDTAWLRQAKVPVVMVHGKEDRVVAYAKAETPMYGSYLIAQKATALQIPNRLKTYEHYRHELQKRFFPFLAFPAVHKRWHEAGEFAADFLYTECLQ
jgi:alpha-beta hydrolase superfamily lysophospholipase